MNLDQSWINDIDPKHQRAIVKKHPTAIKYIENPPFYLIKLVIDNDVDALLDVNTDMCERSQMYLLDQHPDLFHIIKKPTDKVISHALELKPSNIRYVKNPTDQQLIEVFTKEPKLIEFFSGERLEAISDYIKSFISIIK